MTSAFKKNICKFLCFIGADRLFRSINKKKLLIIAYHSICERDNCPSLFTHLPVDIFRNHLIFLRKHYNIISLNDLISIRIGEKPIPKRAALITFDDGFMNNYKNAFQLLKEFNTPAVIFLVTNYIGSNELLWFDDLYLLLGNAYSNGVSIREIEKIFYKENLPAKNTSQLYSIISLMLKYTSPEERSKKIEELRNKVGPYNGTVAENFKLLNWEQIHEMKNSGLIEFGVHTATHRIFSQLSENEWEKEIIAPKKLISNKLNCNTSAFCYPNGIPDVDFTFLQEEYLKRAGFVCSFCTGEWLNSWDGNFFRLGRKSAGNDLTSSLHYFRMNTSGFAMHMTRKPRRFFSDLLSRHQV